MAYTKTNWINDTTELSAENMNHIEDGVEKAYGQLLLAVDSVAPEECTTGDKYYNTEDNKIYTATGTDTWGETGEAAELGIFYVVLETQNIYTYNGETLVSVGGGSGGGDSLPIGTVIAYAGSTAPNGFLLTNGDAVSRTTYKDLFRAIGTTYGTGDGSTTFNLPNIKGKVVVMLDTSDTDFDTLGETGGSKDLQEHGHVEFFVTNDGNINPAVTNDNGSVTGTFAKLEDSFESSRNALLTGTAGTGNSGNLQPYIVLNYIIKVQKLAGEVLSEELPVGAEIDFAGSISDIPIGWEQVDYKLYESSSGTMGNVTLSDSVANYTKITILYRNGDGYSGTVDVLNPNGQTVTLTLSYFNEGTIKFMHWAGKIAINGNIITHITDYYYENNQGSVNTPQSINYISILKVVGYK